MANQVSFKTRVREAAIQYAASYQTYYVAKSYLLLSDKFSKNPYYIIEAEPSNYLHLIGVSSNLGASDFYDKCLNGTLDENDFDLSFHGKDPKESKGSIRQKILALPSMFSIFSSSAKVEEDFEKNVVKCSLASSNSLCTVGFIATPSSRPMTLLRGNELHAERSGSFSLVMSKSRSSDLYSTILVGNDDAVLAKAYDTIKDIISPEIRSRIETYTDSMSATSNPDDHL